MALGITRFAALLLFVGPLSLQAGVAWAFVIGAGSGDLSAPGRWSHGAGSLVRQGVRGLGGGLEYSIAADFCDRLLPRFIDRPQPRCDQLGEAMRRGLDRWAEGHPHLAFVEVSGQVKPQLPPAGVSDPWRGFGAEIDFFALSPGEHPPLGGLGAYTQYYWIGTRPLGANGRELTGVTMTSADIVVSLAPCFHLDPALAGRGCNHFESLMAHEIGHALGLSHPNEFPNRNYDGDVDPTNGLPIDCQQPARGLGVSTNIDPNAVMISSMREPEPVRLQLANDDLAGRNFLLPFCAPVAPVPRPTEAAPTPVTMPEPTPTQEPELSAPDDVGSDPEIPEEEAPEAPAEEE